MATSRVRAFGRTSQTARASIPAISLQIALQQAGLPATTVVSNGCADAQISSTAVCSQALFGTVIYPVPGDSGGGTPVNQWINFDRIDWTISDRTQVFGRYVQQSSDFFPGTNASSPYKGYNTGSTQVNHNLLVSLTHTFGPSVASASKILLTRFNNLQPINGAAVPTLYPNSGSTVQLGQGVINFPGYLPTSPGTAIPFGGPQNFIQLGEDLTWTKGKHTLKFGGEFLFIKDNRVFGAYEERRRCPGAVRHQGRPCQLHQRQYRLRERRRRSQGRLSLQARPRAPTPISTRGLHDPDPGQRTQLLPQQPLPGWRRVFLR